MSHDAHITKRRERNKNSVINFLKDARHKMLIISEIRPLGVAFTLRHTASLSTRAQTCPRGVELPPSCMTRAIAADNAAQSGGQVI
jgi:hypothetical protein